MFLERDRNEEDSITLYAITILVKRSRVDWTITYKKDASRKIVIQLVYYVFRTVVDIKKGLILLLHNVSLNMIIFYFQIANKL